MIKAAALIGHSGQDVNLFLRTKDGFRRSTMLAVANEWEHIGRELDRNRATMIANSVGKMLGGR